MKKLFALILALSILTCTLLGSAFACTDKGNDDSLQFNCDGKFRIMQISDTHCTDQVYSEVIDFIGKALDEYKPDLVVLTGDNVTGGWFMSTPMSVKSAIDQIVAPIDERGVPFTVVYGNHDWQTACPKNLQTSFYQRYDGCLMTDGFEYLHRTANSNLLIKSSSGDKNIFNIWLLDSGSRNIKDEQNPVLQPQIDWYKQTSDALAAQNGGEKLPSVVFQHVPVEEVYKLFTEVSADTKGAVQCKNGLYYVLNNDVATGELNGIPGVAYYNSGEYDAWVEQGDVVAAFFGHDHVNDYYGTTPEGILLGSTKTAGFQSRGDGGERSVRIIDLDESNIESVSTFSVYYSDYYDEYPEQKKEYNIGERLSKCGEYFIDFFVTLFS